MPHPAHSVWLAGLLASRARPYERPDRRDHERDRAAQREDLSRHPARQNGREGGDGEQGHDDACRKYEISMDELLTWQTLFKQFGPVGLFVTRRRKNRMISIEEPMSVM